MAGLEVELQIGEWRGAPLANVIARKRGTDNTGTILLMAHYDTVPGCPGASDDGAGVVSILETMRRTSEMATRNDVLVLFTDGEEIGMLGAKMFAEEHPAFDEVDVVLNFEAIGNGGPCLMFESGPESGELVELWSKAAPHALGGSLMQAIYEWMPNNTDFSTFRDAGRRGLNFAFGGSTGVYHRAEDTSDRLGDRSLNHMLATVGELTFDLANRDLEGMKRGARAALALPFGFTVVWSGRWHVWLAGGIVFVLAILVRKTRRLELKRGLKSLTGALACGVVAGVGSMITWWMAYCLSDFESPLDYEEVHVLLAMSCVGGLASGVLWLNIWNRGRHENEGISDVQLGAALIWTLLWLLFAWVDFDRLGASAPIGWLCVVIWLTVWIDGGAAKGGKRLWIAALLSLGLVPLAPYIGLLVQLASYEWWSGGVMTACLLALGFPILAPCAGFRDRSR